MSLAFMGYLREDRHYWKNYVKRTVCSLPPVMVGKQEIYVTKRKMLFGRKLMPGFHWAVKHRFVHYCFYVKTYKTGSYCSIAGPLSAVGPEKCHCWRQAWDINPRALLFHLTSLSTDWFLQVKTKMNFCLPSDIAMGYWILFAVTLA